MALVSLRIPYPDFEYYQIIDPEEVDANNAQVQAVVNMIIDKLNSILGGEVVDNIRGEAVETSPTAPFDYRNIGDMLTALIKTLTGDGTQETPKADYGYNLEGDLVALRYDTDNNLMPIEYDKDGNPIYPVDGKGNPINTTHPAPSISGAELVALKPIDELDATNVQRALEIVHAFVLDLQSKNSDTALQLSIHKDSDDHDERYYTKTELDEKHVEMLDVFATTIEEQLTSFSEQLNEINELRDAQTQAILDTKTDVSGDFGGTWLGLSMGDMLGVMQETTQLQLDGWQELLNFKTDITGDFNGTWFGMTLEQILLLASQSPAFIEVLPEDPPEAYLGQMWMVFNSKA